MHPIQVYDIIIDVKQENNYNTCCMVKGMVLYMGRPVTSKVKREETAALHMLINKRLLTEFRDSLAKYGYPMNVMLEIFMRQYVLGRIHLDRENMMKLKEDTGERSHMRTPVNGEVREMYFACCRAEKLPTKVPIMEFMKEYTEGKFVPEFREASDNEN